MRQPVIGLEIHIQLLTKTKMFCRCKASFGDEPNTNICPVCMGYPGALPVPNKEAIKMGITLGLAINGEVQCVSDFSRKNYFYPDMPKGYQITQDSIPLIKNGHISVSDEIVKLERIHIEEDSAKMLHEPGTDKTLINFNRAGVPLLEIVTLPCLKTAKTANIFLEKLKQIITYTGISTGKMEEGALRCDVNISLTNPDGSLGQKIEVKNLNSFKAVAKSIEYEIERQNKVLDAGGKIIPETRSWDESKSETFIMRIKDGKADYRFFPEPDLKSLFVTQEMIDEARKNMSELPGQAVERLIKTHNLSEYDASLITSSKEILHYYDLCMKDFQDPKLLANWISSEILKIMNKNNCYINEVGIKPMQLTELLSLILKGTISGKIAKDVLLVVIETGKNPSEIVKEKGLLQVSDTDSLRKIVSEVLEENKNELERYKNGEQKLFGLFMGQCMKKTKGKGNPKMLQTILKELLRDA
ncbi:MAG: Asp-tRNA(Asn)/Glu-tRNA(Gln) amidotransferase subunit GatB [Caldisericia bacterium]|nr:Asp-tRNA(Asn)/Glu-tRNA(Gln) amidotransferase subunit GatB [Caldisericia bacterium]